jgi:hypothetical protein
MMKRLFPEDLDNGKMWPVYSARWDWDEFNRLPAWVPGGSLTTLVPYNATQRRYRTETVEMWAAQAIGNAIRLSSDADFRKMIEHGR